jgi:hypothetical protein
LAVAFHAVAILLIPPIRKFSFLYVGECCATLLDSFSGGETPISSSVIVDPFVADREKLSAMAKKIAA